MPVRHGVRVGVLPDYLANPHPSRFLPYYFMENDNGFVDCYFQACRMLPDEFYYFELRDTRDPTMWYIGDDYVPSGMQLMPRSVSTMRMTASMSSSLLHSSCAQPSPCEPRPCLPRCMAAGVCGRGRGASWGPSAGLGTWAWPPRRRPLGTRP